MEKQLDVVENITNGQSQEMWMKLRDILKKQEEQKRDRIIIKVILSELARNLYMWYN